MNTDIIDKAFAELIQERGVHHKLGETSENIRQLRKRLKGGSPISTDLKLKVLQKSGWRQDDHIYNRQDLVSLLNFYIRTSQAARENGPEYVIEKWEKSKGKI